MKVIALRTDAVFMNAGSYVMRPRSSSSTFACRSAVARIAPSSIGASYVLPVRSSVNLSVSVMKKLLLGAVSLCAAHKLSQWRERRIGRTPDRAAANYRRHACGERRSDLPGAAAQDRDALAVRRHARDVEVVRSDHEVDVRAAPVDARRVGGVDEELEAVPERDVRGRVLVEERVVEHGVERPDPPLAVDERELAEPRRALVELHLRAQRLAVLVGVDLDGAAVLEPDAEA